MQALVLSITPLNTIKSRPISSVKMSLFSGWTTSLKLDKERNFMYLKQWTIRRLRNHVQLTNHFPYIINQEYFNNLIYFNMLIMFRRRACQRLGLEDYHNTGRGQLEIRVIMAIGATLSMAISSRTGARWLGIQDSASLMSSTWQLLIFWQHSFSRDGTPGFFLGCCRCLHKSNLP